MLNCTSLHICQRKKKNPTAAAGVVSHSNTCVLPAPPARPLDLHSHEFCWFIYSHHFRDLCRTFRVWSLYAKAIWLKHWKKKSTVLKSHMLGSGSGKHYFLKRMKATKKQWLPGGHGPLWLQLSFSREGLYKPQSVHKDLLHTVNLTSHGKL